MTTKDDMKAAHKEVDANYEFFKKMLPKWRNKKMPAYANYVLLHHQQLVDFFESEKDAVRTGERDYGWGNFSVQAIKEVPIDLGFQSHVLFP